MEKIYSVTDLNNAILLLENKQAIEELELRDQFHFAYESLKPLNIIKNVFKHTFESNNLKENILSNSINLTAGFLSKILFKKTTKSPFKKIFGNIVLFSVKKMVENNTELIILLLNKFITKTSSKKQ